MSDSVLVTGANGFVGLNIVRALIKKGYRVIGWTRREESKPPIASPLFSHEWGDLGSLSPEADKKLKSILSQVNYVVHSAGRTPQSVHDHAEMEKINVDVTGRLVSLCTNPDFKRFIYLGSQSARVANPGAYGLSKKKAEEILSQQKVPWVVVRPSIIYGPGSSGVFGKFSGLVKKLPVVPVPGVASRFCPVYVGDVVRLIEILMERSSLRNHIYDLSGSDGVTLADLIRQVGQQMGLMRLVIPIPFSLMMIGARVLGTLTKNPPVTTDNLLGLAQVVEVDLAPIRDEFTFEPIPLREGLKLTFSKGGSI